MHGSFGAIPLDNAKPEGLDHSIKLYGLLQGPSFGDVEDRIYKAGFSSLLQQKCNDARAHFAAYCQHPRADREVAAQAERLLQVWGKAMTAPCPPMSYGYRTAGEVQSAVCFVLLSVRLLVRLWLVLLHLSLLVFCLRSPISLHANSGSSLGSMAGSGTTLIR